ncbi:MAG: hypothetical protein LBQ42_08730 [Synergistaceae bacterium]|jgi:hypothetical protein|nr:hypothetical protein [Synergistaceae bacterium]
MSKKKDKKKPQQNFSLKERLEKHWNNRNWGAFVSLFLRDREASMRTPWASQWDNALYNCLTNALFVEKDIGSARMAHDLIRAESGIAGLSPLLCDCADVASDFLSAYDNGVLVEPSPLLAETNLPSPYSALREGFASWAKETKGSPQNEAEALVKKLAAQYGRLWRAKTAIPYATWLKIAEQLKEVTKKGDHANTFCAVCAIIALIHKLFLTGKGENLLRDATQMTKHALFIAIPPNQSHPAVRSLWEFFCQSGERKYGKGWGGIARVLQLAFVKPSQPEVERLRDQYRRLVKMDKNEFLEDILQSALLVDTSQWTDQEHYILRMFLVASLGDGDCGMPEPHEFPHFLESLKVLGELGRKWRPHSPWTRETRHNFENVVFNLPRKLFAAFPKWDLPYDAMSASTLLYFALTDPYDTEIKKAILSKGPLRLAKDEIHRVAEALLEEGPSRKDVRAIRSNLDDASSIALCEELVRQAVTRSAENVADEYEPSQQFWFSLQRDALAELADVLPASTLEGCFCRLCADAKPMRLSTDPAKVDAFFDAQSSLPKFAPLLWMTLIDWPDVEPEFIIRLFEKNYPQYQTQANENSSFWDSVTALVMRIKHKPAREIVAAGICNVMKRDKGNKRKPFREAIAFLEQLPKMTDAQIRKSKKFLAHEAEMPSFEEIRDIFSRAFKKRPRFKGF